MDVKEIKMEIDLTAVVTKAICGGCFADPDDDEACHKCGGYKLCQDIEKVLSKAIKELIKEWKANLAP